jgi:uncharacterized lipoprotein YmbA
MTLSRPSRLIAHALAAMSLLGILALAACTSSHAGHRYYQARAVAFAPSVEPTPTRAATAHAAHPGD